MEHDLNILMIFGIILTYNVLLAIATNKVQKNSIYLKWKHFKCFVTFDHFNACKYTFM